ncbi:hypothetical protein NMY22_g7629 [Coprinellus aureogranulatus]|nr:hypothetical protein NMY22_g7629 [Coprinellus aureogranulatus]
MPPSSEEPLHSGLSVNAGFGYYPANAHQILDGGKYTIVRKLGWGPRSSTWLVRRTKKGSMYYLAAQIFTVAASKAVAERLHPIIRNRLLIKTDIVSLPTVHSRFWETSVHGKHFCMTLNPYGPPIKSLLRKAVKDGQAGLPVHTVQYTTSRVVQALSVFHHKKIMHGDVTPERVVFDILMGSSCVEPLLDAEPTSEAVFVDGFPVLPSQPLDLNKHKWNEPMSHVADWMLSLVWYGHAQASPYKVEAGHDYCSAPETLLANPTCGPETDIWMLGCLVSIYISMS